MPTTMTRAVFAEWEPQQSMRFALVHGKPVRLPDPDQGLSRVARARLVAIEVMASREKADAWMGNPQEFLGGLEPDALAADSEEGCQLVLRRLVTMARSMDASLG